MCKVSDQRYFGRFLGRFQTLRTQGLSCGGSLLHEERALTIAGELRAYCSGDEDFCQLAFLDASVRVTPAVQCTIFYSMTLRIQPPWPRANRQRRTLLLAWWRSHQYLSLSVLGFNEFRLDQTLHSRMSSLRSADCHQSLSDPKWLKSACEKFQCH